MNDAPLKFSEKCAFPATARTNTLTSAITKAVFIVSEKNEVAKENGNTFSSCLSRGVFLLGERGI